MSDVLSVSSKKGVILIYFLFTVAIILLSIPKKWKDATKTRDDGTVTLSDDWSGAVERKKRQYAEHELYMLTAARDGYFICGHCPGGRFFLKEFEVYRYGTTGEGKNSRGYSENWLARHALNYNIIMTGDLATVRIEEAALIGSYAITHENLIRPISGTPGARPYWYRLVLPPGNNSLE